MYNWTLQESVIKTLYMILCKDGEKLVFKLLVLGVTERYLRECSYNFSPGIFIGNHVFHYDQWFDLTIPIIHPYNLKNENEVGTVSKLTLLCSVIGIDSLEFSSPQKKNSHFQGTGQARSILIWSQFGGAYRAVFGIQRATKQSASDRTQRVDRQQSLSTSNRSRGVTLSSTRPRFNECIQFLYIRNRLWSRNFKVIATIEILVTLLIHLIILYV